MFDASASSDTVGSITDYAWDFERSGAFATDGGGDSSQAHTFPVAEHVTVSLRVTNTVGQTNVVKQDVTVLPPSTSNSPAASISPASLSFKVTSTTSTAARSTAIRRSCASPTWARRR